MAIYIFDGSLEGLLTAIFEFYERKPEQVTLVTQKEHQPVVLREELLIHNDEAKAKRVWSGLAKKLPAQWLQRFYGAWLSEQSRTFNDLFGFACYIFNSPEGAFNNYGNEYVLAIAQTDKKVHREKHRMEAFVRFKKTEDGMFFAHIEPDFNVLPLILKHFRNRYADQQWIIYDIRRKYGIFYDREKVHEVTLDLLNDGAEKSITLLPPGIDEKEALYSVLWKDYFESTNIPARKNIKLHIRHVPKRYWKYLTEKQFSP